VTYPYVGYYRYYDYPYFTSYGYADCGYYNGYYIRFGRYHSSYFSSCSGFGSHAYHGHHHHVYSCAVHGHHYYHIRDCAQCYPRDVFHEDVEVPQEEVGPVEPPVEAAPAGAGDAPAEGGDAPAEGGALAPPADNSDAFFASLKPAQLSFSIGIMQFREGQYDAATEAFYNASVEDPDNRLIKVFLAQSLFAIGEFEFSAEYLRLGLRDWAEFPQYDWTVATLYSRPEDFRSQLELLERETALHPSDADLALVLGFVRFSSGDHMGAADAYDVARSLTSDDEAKLIAERFLREVEFRSGAFPRPPVDPTTGAVAVMDPATAGFLATLDVSRVADLDMR